MPMKKLVIFTGAGISAESGIKTFRDSDGLWENYKIEDVGLRSTGKASVSHRWCNGYHDSAVQAGGIRLPRRAI